MAPQGMVHPRWHCGEVAERSKALRQGRNLFGGVGSNPTLVTFPTCDRMAEWSKAPDPSSGLFGGAGSNPAPVMYLQADAQRSFAKCTPAWIRTRVARFKVWSANHYTTGASCWRVSFYLHLSERTCCVRKRFTSGYVAQW